MGKGIIIINDIPALCFDCRFCAFDDFDRRVCVVNRKCTDGVCKPVWCPVNEIPERPDYPPINENSFIAGWNSCLDEIERKG